MESKEINDKMHELNKRALECAKLAYEIYHLSKDEKSDDALELKRLIGIFEKDEWFEEFCWVCQKVKEKCHDDESTSLDNPGFICFECELARENRHKEMDIELEDSKFYGHS